MNVQNPTKCKFLEFSSLVYFLLLQIKKKHAWFARLPLQILLSIFHSNFELHRLFSFANLACAWLGVVLVPQVGFLFVGLHFFLSASCPLLFLSFFLWPCLIHARMLEKWRAFVHGHTFLHSWSGPLTLVVGLLQGCRYISVQSYSCSLRVFYIT